MTNIIASLVILLIVGWAVRYIYKSKKSGVKCIGCPNGGSCHEGCNTWKNKKQR